MTPAIVPDAEPPSPFVTSHSRFNSLSGSSASGPAQVMRRTLSVATDMRAAVDSICSWGDSRWGLVSVHAWVRSGPEDHSGMARYVPASVRLYWSGPATTVARVVGREHGLPDASFRRGQQRFRHDRRVQVTAKIDEQQSVVAIVPEESKHQGFRA